MAGALGLALALRLVAVFQANVHWDEFGLLEMADRSAATGVLQSGGRPGLAVALLIPFAERCDDEISVIRRARVLWLAIGALWLAGVFAWAAELQAGEPRRWHHAALATALVGLVPAVLDASLQVRTDQIALAGGAWGGALLLASRRRPALAGAAGVCLAVGFLGSQKLLYVAALAGLAAAGQLLILRELRPAREAARAGALLAGAALVWLGFRAFAAAAFELPAASQTQRPLSAEFVRRGLSLFEFYRNTIGWSQYRQILPTLAAHGVLLAGLFAASLLAWRTGRRNRTELIRIGVAWAALALGGAVALFHAASFAYFWMTLALFPALAFALAAGPIERAAPAPLRPLARAGVWALLLAPAAFQLAEDAWLDAQAVQRESLQFVHRNFPREATGFHPESGLFCQRESERFPTYFSQLIHHQFGRGEGLRGRQVASLEQAFRERPVSFLLQSYRLNQFPLELRRFWADHYQPYRASVFVAGQRLSGARGEAARVDLIVPGRYRWLPESGTPALDVADHRLPPGGSIELASGSHPVRFVEDVSGGLLVLALDDPPGPAPQPFYQ